MATLGVLDILISVKDDNVQSQLNKTEKEVKGWGNKVSAWTIAKGQMISRFAETAVRSTARVMKDTIGEAVRAFGTYEQLEQGAQLMFGKGFDFIIDKAENAYQKVQISKNEYLEQANAYATGLKNSLNGDAEAAAVLADRIITAQSDVVAATGANRESVENAFKGLLRGNFTMLDNLQIGIKGTKTGMKEVIDQVNQWNKANGKATKYQMDNLADMNNALIDYIEMVGMAGYAQAEGADTLEGSIASTKAAWKDLITNIGRGRDIRKSVENFGQAAKKAFTNLRPVIRNAVSGVFKTVKELMPEIGDLFNDLKQDLKESDVPILRVLGEGLDKVQTAWNGLNALINDFPGTVEKLQSSDDPFAKLIGGGLSFAEKVFTFIKNNAETIVNNLDKIAIAFAGIKIGSGVLKFLSLLQSSGVVSGLKHLFDNGNNPTIPTGSPTGAPTAPVTNTKGGGFWNTTLKGWLKDAGTTAAIAAPFAMFIDGLISDQRFIEEATRKGQQQRAEYGEKSEQYAGNEMFSLWDQLTKYTTAAGSAEDKAGMKQFVADYMRWFNDEAVNPALDRMQDAMTWEQFNRFDDIMHRMNAGEMFYSSEDIDNVKQAMTDAIAAVESVMQSNPVKPTVDISAMQTQLNGAKLTVPVSAVFAGGMFGAPKAKGDWYVPRDNYPILAHRGELLLNQSQARRYRDGESGGSGNIPAMIARSVKESMKRVNFVMDKGKVADFTWERTNRNIRAQSYSKVKAYGG